MWNGIINYLKVYTPGIYSLHSRWKLLLLLIAVVIGAGSLLYTHRLVTRLASEERKKVELWAEATRILAESSETSNLEFLLKVIEANNTVPVILATENDSVIYSRNLDPSQAKKQLIIMKKKHHSIIINLTKNKRNYIFYDDSILITKLTFYPYIQLFVIIIFIIVAYIAFHNARTAEQNKVWLGLSRETAHQLGTPTSSLMAWIELLKDKDEVRDIVFEIEKDVQRLNIITERFSKIGSQPDLVLEDLIAVLNDVVLYMQHRIPKSAIITLESAEPFLYIKMNAQLFGWVIENLIKNALDAIKNNGFIKITVTTSQNLAYINVQDNGKGIAVRDLHRIFKPGYTTKKRGWGLGLSLTKRIIENYHNGKIFVVHSALNVGTTFRIVLPYNSNSNT